MAGIMWHRRETRRQTENTNVMPVALEGLILLDKNSNAPIHHQLASRTSLAFRLVLRHTHGLCAC